MSRFLLRRFLTQRFNNLGQLFDEFQRGVADVRSVGTFAQSTRKSHARRGASTKTLPENDHACHQACNRRDAGCQGLFGDEQHQGRQQQHAEHNPQNRVDAAAFLAA